DRADERLEQLGELVRRAAGAPTVDVESHVRILHRIGEAISATLDVDEVLRIALDALTHVTGHEISSLHLLSPDGATLHLRGDRGAKQIGLAPQKAQRYSATRRQLDDLKSAEAQLIEVEKLSTVGKLAAGLAHETRNRLTAILGQAELLLMGSDGPIKSRERLHTIVQETSRAAQMLQNLLRFSGRQSSERRSLRLEDLIKWVLELKGHQ